MKILPSIREKKRYIIFDLLSNSGKIRERDLIDAIWSSGTSLAGNWGMGLCSLWLIKFNGRRGILRCSRGEVGKARAILTMVNEMNGERAAIDILGISGSIKKAVNKYFKDK
jgi:ribonuclease P/MRP protein subunit POP5